MVICEKELLYFRQYDFHFLDELLAGADTDDVSFLVVGDPFG